MKKNIYVAPKAEVIALTFEGMLAASVDINIGGEGGDVLVKEQHTPWRTPKSVWDE
ncbi:MAG: hypothetical protein II222_05845 [Paraprevotella sp.]|nr:hypothetical protein [Paraprevotella sp.]